MDSKKTLKIGKFFRLPITVVIGVLVIIVLIAFLGIWSAFYTQRVKVFTEKTEYKEGDALKIQVENYLRQRICFSSCYPYYIERENKGWQPVTFDFCPEPSIVEKCIEPKNVKAFQFAVPSLENGQYRIAIPVCVDCSIQEGFKEDRWFYSNNFIIE